VRAVKESTVQQQLYSALLDMFSIDLIANLLSSKCFHNANQLSQLTGSDSLSFCNNKCFS